MGACTSVYLPGDLRAKVARQADAQGRSASSVIVEAVRMKYARSEESAQGLTLGHIARLDARIDKSVRDGVMIKEALLLFVRVWLEHTPEIDPHLEDAAAASAAARFERFLDYIAASIDSGRSAALQPPSEHVTGAAP